MERADWEDELIARQIGRAPRGRYEVATRCVHGFPQVLRVPPKVDAAPFPTLFWLSCPFLVRAVGRLEAAGWVARVEASLQDDAALRAEVARAHAAYAEERRLLGKPDGDAGPAAAGGVAGIADWARVKCLHAHVAHALVRVNPIGALILAVLPETACPGEQKICSSLVRGRSSPRSTDRSP